MKPTVTPKAKRKVRLRFKAKDLKRVDLEELRRRLEATQQPEIETVPEPVEEEPVVVVPSGSPEVVEPGAEQPSLWVRLRKRQPLKVIVRLWAWLGSKAEASVEVIHKGWVEVGQRIQQHWKGIAIGCASIAVVCFVIKFIAVKIGSAISHPMAKKDWPDVPNTQLNIEWEARAEDGNPEVQYLWASHLSGELDEDPKPAARVFELFKRAAGEDHPRAIPAMRNLAWCYEHGVGTDVDSTEAGKWEDRAGAAGLSLVDGTPVDSRVSRALISGLVFTGWLGFLAAARGIWRRRLASMPEASREQARAVVFIDSISFARRFLDRFGAMLLPAVFLGLAWLMHHVEASALLAFFIAMVIGLPASVLLLYIATRLRREPFPELNYFRGRNMYGQHSGSAQFNLIVRKLPLLFVLSLLMAQFVGLAWGVLLSIGLVGVMCSREIDVLPQLDVWPGPECGVVDSQKTNWFIRRLPLHVVYLAVYFAMGWCALLAFVLFAEFVCMALGKQIRRHFVIIGDREPPRLTENTAGMISRRMRFSPNMLSFWWAFWAFMLVCASFAGSPREAPVGVTPEMLGMLALLWGCLKTSVARMRDNDAVFQSLPWTMFVSWAIGMSAAVVVGVGGGNPVIGFVVAFGIALVVGQQLSGGSAKPPGGNFLKRQLSLNLDNESWLMGWWRIKSPHLLFTAGCIGMLLALGPQMFSGENLRQLVIGILGIGLLVIAALGFVLLKFDVKLLPEKQLPSDARSRDSAAKRDIWGVLTENAFLVFAGSMALAWLLNPVRDVGGFEHYWARALFMGLPVMLAATWLGISVRHRETASTLPKPWIQPTAEGVNVRWRMFLGAAVLVAVLLVSVGTWVYGEKRTTPDVIELSGNSYILLESGFLLPTDSLP